MVSHDLLHSTVANQIALDQGDSHSTPEFKFREGNNVLGEEKVA